VLGVFERALLLADGVDCPLAGVFMAFLFDLAG
jgi:hypothetical protein